MSGWWDDVKWADIDEVAQAHRHGHPDRSEEGMGAYLPFHFALEILTDQFDLEESKACDFLFPPMEVKSDV
jgi:hypothetical protein